MQAALQQAQKMTQEISKAKAEMELFQAEGVAGGGVVRVVISGTGDCSGVTIKAESMDPNDPEMLGDLVRAAINDANRQIKSAMKERMEKATGGMPIPALF